MSGARDQVARLLALTPYLQTQGELPLARVAADFGVTPKQIQQDLQVLWMCGLPGLGPGDLIDVDFEAFQDDPEGLVRIGNAEFLDRPFRLQSTEAAALIVALRALREGSTAASREIIERTLAKLEEATAADRTHLEVQLPVDTPRLVELRAEIDRAITADRQLLLDYYVPNRDETTLRAVDPLTLLSRDGRDYLDAWCHVAEARRLFRLSRIMRATVQEVPREVRDLSPRDLSTVLFEPAAEDLLARIRVAPTHRWVADYYPIVSSTAVGDGWLELTLHVADPRWLIRLALRLSPGVEVVEPVELAERTRSIARAALDLYDGA